MTMYDPTDLQHFQNLMDMYRQTSAVPPDDEATLRRCVDILEEMHVLIHQRRVPKYADEGCCGHGLLPLYEKLELWDRFLHWLIRTRDLEENTLFKVKYTFSIF